MLDYPRQFSKTDTFAIRSFFWWGHYFSITLHLSGKFKTHFEPKLIAALENGSLPNFEYCITADPWDYDIRPETYQPLQRKEDVKRCSGFIKVAKKIPLQQWDQVIEFYTKNYALLLEILSN